MLPLPNDVPVTGTPTGVYSNSSCGQISGIVFARIVCSRGSVQILTSI